MSTDRKVTKKMRAEGATCSICSCPLLSLYRIESGHNIHPGLRECVEALGSELTRAYNMASDAWSRAGSALHVANYR